MYIGTSPLLSLIRNIFRSQKRTRCDQMFKKVTSAEQKNLLKSELVACPTFISTWWSDATPVWAALCARWWTALWRRPAPNAFQKCSHIQVPSKYLISSGTGRAVWPCYESILRKMAPSLDTCRDSTRQRRKACTVCHVQIHGQLAQNALPCCWAPWCHRCLSCNHFLSQHVFREQK